MTLSVYSTSEHKECKRVRESPNEWSVCIRKYIQKGEDRYWGIYWGIGIDRSQGLGRLKSRTGGDVTMTV